MTCSWDLTCLFRELRESYATAQPPSQPPDNHQLSKYWKWGTIVLYALLVLGQIILLGQFGNIVYFPLCYTFAFIIYKQYQKRANDGRLDPNITRKNDLLRGFFHCFWGGSGLALVSEEIFAAIIALVFGISSNFASPFKKGMSNHPKNPTTHIYIFLTAFCVAGLLEEFTKGYITQYCIKRYLPYRSNLNQFNIRSIVWLGLFVGLGFGTVEGVIYTCVYSSTGGIIGQLFTLLIRILLAIPFHTVLGFMWGIELAQKECLKKPTNWFYVGIKQVLWHGLYDFGVMEYSLFEGDAGIGLQLLSLVLGYFVLAGALVESYYLRYRPLVNSQSNISYLGLGDDVNRPVPMNDHNISINQARPIPMNNLVSIPN